MLRQRTRVAPPVLQVPVMAQHGVHLNGPPAPGPNRQLGGAGPPLLQEAGLQARYTVALDFALGGGDMFIIHHIKC